MLDNSRSLLSAEEIDYIEEKSEVKNPDVRPEIERDICKKTVSMVQEFNLIFDYIEQKSLEEIFAEIADDESFDRGSEALIAFLYLARKEKSEDPVDIIETGIALGEKAANPFKDYAKVQVYCQIEQEYEDLKLADIIQELDTEDVLSFIDGMAVLGLIEVEGYDPDLTAVQFSLRSSFPGTMDDFVEALDETHSVYDEKEVDLEVTDDMKGQLHITPR